MGTYFKYFIEYKPEKNANWELVSFNNPIDKLSWKDSDTYVNHDYVLGIVRDIFSARGFRSAPFCNRGFPDDIGSELKSILDKEYQELLDDAKKSFDTKEMILNEELFNKTYKVEYIPKNRDFDLSKDFSDYRYYQTFCTLNELDIFQTQQLLDAEKSLSKYQDELQFDKLNCKLDTVIAILQNKSIKNKTTKKIKEDLEDLSIQELQEDVDEYKSLGDWISGISSIVNFYSQGWIDYNNIRIIGYLC